MDSSTLGNLARDQKTDPAARLVKDILCSGAVVPFITWHQIEELIQHGNDEVYRARMEFLRSLKFVAFPKVSNDHANIGSIVDLHHAEIAFAFKNPNAEHHQTIAAVRPRMTNGFATGEQLYRSNWKFWHVFRQQLAEHTHQDKAVIASLSHFHVEDPKSPFPLSSKGLKLRSADQAAKHFDKIADQLAEKMKQNGDNRVKDASSAARQLMQEAYEENLPALGSDKDFIAEVLKLYKVDPLLLPSKPTLQDVTEESHFQHVLSLTAKRMLLPHAELASKVRPHLLPSYFVEKQLRRAIKTLQKAEAGNLNDLALACFGVYVDYIDVDKRIRELIAQIARKIPLPTALENKVLRYKGHAGLADQLQTITAA